MQIICECWLILNGKNHYGFAGETEEGDCEGKYRTEEKENRRNLVADKEFLNTAFSLLSHARDINGSLNVLLEQIGRKYQQKANFPAGNRSQQSQQKRRSAAVADTEQSGRIFLG